MGLERWSLKIDQNGARQTRNLAKLCQVIRLSLEKKAWNCDASLRLRLLRFVTGLLQLAPGIIGETTFLLDDAHVLTYLLHELPCHPHGTSKNQLHLGINT